AVRDSAVDPGRASAAELVRRGGSDDSVVAAAGGARASGGGRRSVGDGRGAWESGGAGRVARWGHHHRSRGGRREWHRRPPASPHGRADWGAGRGGGVA